MNSRSPAVRDDQLVRRIVGEFLEMPGLRLTCPQAQRLWGLDEETCAALLQGLIDIKFLARGPDGTYVRLTEGRMTPSTSPMAKADLESPAATVAIEKKARVRVAARR